MDDGRAERHSNSRIDNIRGLTDVKLELILQSFVAEE